MKQTESRISYNGIRVLCAEAIVGCYKDLVNANNHIRKNIRPREEINKFILAFQWFTGKTDSPLTYRECLSNCGGNPVPIRRKMLEQVEIFNKQTNSNL